MTVPRPANPASAGRGKGGAASLGPADWLCLAAAPTFAAMALLTGILDGGQMAMCPPVPDPFPLTGMVPMYLLMCAFHLAPWLRLAFGKRVGAR